MLCEAYPALERGLDAHPEDLAGDRARRPPGAGPAHVPAPRGVGDRGPVGSGRCPPGAPALRGAREAAHRRARAARATRATTSTSRRASCRTWPTCAARWRWPRRSAGRRRASGAPLAAGGEPCCVRRRRHGQARGARAQRRKRHRPDALLRDRRRREPESSRCTSTSRASRSASSRRSTRRPRTASSGASTCACAPRGRAGRSSTRSRRRSATTRRGAAPGSARRSCARGPSRGTCAFGARLLEALAPFVWRRAVDPRIVDEMTAMLARARAEAGERRGDDLKIGPGGIREVEFFAQSLQLVWGGREPRVRGTNTLDALRRLRARGFVSEREEAELSDAYLFLRRLEHRVQFATGLQTHALPADAAMSGAIARSLGYDGAAALARELDGRARAACRRGSRRSGREPASRRRSLRAPLGGARRARRGGRGRGGERALRSVGVGRPAASPARARAAPGRPARRDDARSRCRRFARLLVDALADAADPEQADAPARGVLRAPRDAGRLRARARRRSAHGARARVAARRERVPRRGARRPPGPRRPRRLRARRAVAGGRARAGRRGGCRARRRRARRRTPSSARCAAPSAASRSRSASPISRASSATREVAHALTALADATLDHACRFAMRERGLDDGRGLAVIAMGKLGGREIGYGSDLDLLFVYEAHGDATRRPSASRASRSACCASWARRTARAPATSSTRGCARRAARGCSSSRSRPSRATRPSRREGWERQALVKARACAGDAELGDARADRGARRSVRARRAGARAHAPPAHAHGARADARAPRPRARPLRPEARTRGRRRRRVRRRSGCRCGTAATRACGRRRRRWRSARSRRAGTSRRPLADALRDGWRFLRRLEQRLRVSHGTSATLLEEGAPGLAALARRMGMHDAPRARAGHALLERYLAVTREVRAAYLRVLGIDSGNVRPTK